jgi:hypothetical protein
MNPKTDLEAELVKKITILQDVHGQNPEKYRERKALFLHQAEELRKTLPETPVQTAPNWKQRLGAFLSLKKIAPLPILSPVISILLVLALFFSGTGITIAAAQNSQPDQFLYDIKLLSEEIRLEITSNPLTKIQLMLEYANRRAEEINTLIQAGNLPPESVLIRYQTQLEQALQFAASLSEEQLNQVYSLILIRLQNQENLLLQDQNANQSNQEAALAQLVQMLQDRINWFKNNLDNPGGLQEYLDDQEKERTPENQNTGFPGMQGTAGPEATNPKRTQTPSSDNQSTQAQDSGNCTVCPQPTTNPGNHSGSVSPQSPILATGSHPDTAVPTGLSQNPGQQGTPTQETGSNSSGSDNGSGGKP